MLGFTVQGLSLNPLIMKANFSLRQLCKVEERERTLKLFFFSLFPNVAEKFWAFSLKTFQSSSSKVGPRTLQRVQNISLTFKSLKDLLEEYLWELRYCGGIFAGPFVEVG